MIEIGLNKGMLTMNYKITSDQEILEFLSEANKITFKWSNLLFDKKHFKFLCVFWNHPERIKKLIPSDKISEWEKDVCILNEIKNLETFMFEKYKKLISYTVFKLFKKSKSYYMHSDFINEAYIVFKKCVWYYKNNNIKFTTYLFHAIASKIQQIKYKQKNCKINIEFYSNDTINSSKIFNEKNKLNISFEEFSFDEIINNSSLNKKEIKVLELKFKLGKLWVKEAKSIILKSNGKPYSSYGLRVILEKAINKLREKYKEEYFNISI
jgi:hypothetical protein